MLRIRELREKLGMNQGELARKMEVAQPSVVLWEKGECYPTADKLPRLASVLGADIDALYAPDESA